MLFALKCLAEVLSHTKKPKATLVFSLLLLLLLLPLHYVHSCPHRSTFVHFVHACPRSRTGDLLAGTLDGRQVEVDTSGDCAIAGVSAEAGVSVSDASENGYVNIANSSGACLSVYGVCGTGKAEEQKQETQFQHGLSDVATMEW